MSGIFKGMIFAAVMTAAVLFTAGIGLLVVIPYLCLIFLGAEARAAKAQ